MLQAPLFFHDGRLNLHEEIALEPDTARHLVQVLRMQQGQAIHLTNGAGLLAKAGIKQVQKKSCMVEIAEVQQYARRSPSLHLAIAFTKNTSRNEWLLEKITELGVTSIIPLSSARSEREKFRHDRWHKILVAAILQSQQYYLPELKELSTIEEIIKEFSEVPVKLVAHCIEATERVPVLNAIAKDKETLLLIGPEGDFTAEEVNRLTSKGFTGISMGINRLRTETAAVAACTCFNMVNNE